MVTAASTPETPSCLGRKVGHESAEDRDRDLDGNVVEPSPDLGDRRADQQPDRDPAGNRDDEVDRGVEEREAAADRRRDGDPVGDQRRRVVDQALPLDQGDQPARGAELARDRRRGHRVGRRDDGAEREGDRPGQVDELVADDRDRTGRKQHQADRGQRQRAGVGAHRAQIGEEGRHVEQRRQEDHQDQVGVELDVRDAGQVTDGDRPDHEHDRVRDVEQPGDHAQRRDRDAQAQDQELGLVHGQPLGSGSVRGVHGARVPASLDKPGERLGKPTPGVGIRYT